MHHRAGEGPGDALDLLQRGHDHLAEHDVAPLARAHGVDDLHGVRRAATFVDREIDAFSRDRAEIPNAVARGEYPLAYPISVRDISVYRRR